MAHALRSRSTDLHAWYGESHVLHGVDFTVDEGEVVTLLGRNGAGRTSTLRAILGLTGSRKGSIKVHGTETIGMATHRIARLGIGYCPEERGIFSSLSAEENLMLPPRLGEGGMSVEEIYAMFPNLKERATARARGCRAASSRCWPSRASCAPARGCCCSTRSPKAWRRSSCRSSAEMVGALRRAGLHDRDGRAELPLRRAAGRPLLRDGARPRDPAVHPGRTAVTARAAARVPGCLRCPFHCCFSTGVPR